MKLADARWSQVEHQSDFMQVHIMLVEKRQQQLLAFIELGQGDFQSSAHLFMADTIVVLRGRHVGTGLDELIQALHLTGHTRIQALVVILFVGTQD